MIDNVPDWLTEKVRGLRGTVDPADRQTVYYAAAGWTIAWYLRKDIQSPNIEGFFDPPGETPIDKSDSLWHAHVNRATLVAETLFLLRSSPGFGEQRKRLTERTLRSAFFEMLAAKQFFKAGFEILARPETGALGEDFDFTAVRADECVNVEVTALTADTFSENTILNALNRKRRQVPNNAPAVIYCVMPEKWFPDPSNWNYRLPMIAEKFLTNTRRINVLVAWTERRIPLGDGPGGCLVVLRNSFRNPSPRITTESVGFLFDGTPAATALGSIQTGMGLEELADEANSTEFFQWVDQLVPIESK